MSVRGLVGKEWLDGTDGFSDWSRDHLDTDDAELVGISHYYKCPNKNAYGYGYDPNLTERLADCTPACHPEYRVVLFEDRVLSTYERNYHDDSDFYALVWTGTEIKPFLYGTTRCSSTGWSAKIDATEEIKAEARIYLEKIAYEDCVALAEKEAQEPKVGRRVRSWRGRKREPVEGTVFWLGEHNRGYSDWNAEKRVGFETDSGERVFTPLSRAEVIDPAPVDLDKCRISAKAIADGNRWRRESRGWYG